MRCTKLVRLANIVFRRPFDRGANSMDGHVSAYRMKTVRFTDKDKVTVAGPRRSIVLSRRGTKAWVRPITGREGPASQTKIKALMERGFHRPGDVERRLGYHVGQLGG